jgi:hypothetical protein
MSKVADEYEEIARRLKELEADNAIGWSVCDLYGYYVGYNYQNQYQSAVSSGSLPHCINSLTN